MNAIEASKPRPRYLIGRDAKIMARIAKLLPDRAVDRLNARNLALDDPPKHAATAHRSDMAGTVG